VSTERGEGGRGNYYFVGRVISILNGKREQERKKELT